MFDLIDELIIGYPVLQAINDQDRIGINNNVDAIAAIPLVIFVVYKLALLKCLATRLFDKLTSHRGDINVIIVLAS